MNYPRHKYNIYFNIIKYYLNFIYSILKNILRRDRPMGNDCYKTEKIQYL